MPHRARLLALVGFFCSLTARAQPAGELAHRIWLLDGVVEPETVAALRAAGIDGVVLPVGDATVGEGSCRLTLRPLGDLKALAGWSVAPLVWIEGQGKATGDAAAFAGELAPVQRALPGGVPLLLVARRSWPGLPAFAAAVRQRLGLPVELALPVQEIARSYSVELWRGVEPVAIALGNPPALGFPPATLADQLDSLASLDEAGVRYRVALVVVARAAPPPGPAGASLSAIALPSVASFRPGEWGDVFTLRRTVDWGGVHLEARESVEVEVVDTVRYHRDLGLLLRAVRSGLAGWDTAGLPPREPALGMSREALLDYLRGGLPYPTPEVGVAWASPGRLKVEVVNPTPHSCAVATAGNWVELEFVGGHVTDIGLGAFSGADYGRVEGGVWRRCAAVDASAVRLFFMFLPPSSRLDGATVAFYSRPSELSARWSLRLGDGTSVSGPATSTQAR